MSIDTDRVSRLVAKIGVVDEKISNLQAEKNECIQEVQALLGGVDGVSSVPARRTIPTSAISRVKNKVKLMDRLEQFLQANGGRSLHDLASALGVEPKQIGLAAMHLGKSGRIMVDGSGDKVMYFATRPAATTQPNTNAVTD